MAKLTAVPIDQAEPGMKLAAAVVSASGQTLLSAGAVLDETHIAFLKRRGIRSVKVIEAQFGHADTEKVQQTIDKMGSRPAAAEDDIGDVDVTTIDPEGPTVVLKRLPADAPPVDAPTKKDVHTEEIARTQKEWRTHKEEREKKLAEKHGETFTKVVRALGDPKPVGPAESSQTARLFTDAVKDMTQNMYLEKNLNSDTLDLLTKNITMEMITRQGMSTLLSRAQAAGQYLLAHMVNVGVYSMYVGIQMELSSQEIQDTAIGGLLCDIGMLALPESFWTQDRDLWPKEQKQLNRHPDESRKMILEAPGAREEWARVAAQHHERLDGSGYPNKLKAKEIDLPSRIVQICDVYAAATADRAYRDAHLPDDAMRQIMGKPDLYDRTVVEIFCQMVGFYPENFLVLLSSGEHAVVVSTNPKNVFRPTVRLRKDKHGRPLLAHDQVILDLATRPDLRIIKILEDDSARWV